MEDKMEDENKAKKIINITIAIIITALIIVIGIIVYKNIMQKINNDRFTTYLKENKFKQNEDNIYTKTENTHNKQTTYQAIIDEYLLTKEESKSTDTEFTSITAYYKKDGTIETTYKLEGYNKDGEIGTLYQKGSYKNGNFTCQIISNNKFKTKCPEMKKEAQEFEKEVNQILENNNINIKYITLKDKNIN